jgi:hypothetical protein
LVLPIFVVVLAEKEPFLTPNLPVDQSGKTDPR